MSAAEERLAPHQDASYRTIAIVLHWLIAALIIVELCIGWWMNHFMVDHSPPQEALQDFHVSLGLVTLGFILIRVVVRLVYAAPPLPAGMPAWERNLAHAVHALFYVLMLALPLTGWALLSVRKGDIPFFGLDWPRLPGLMPPGPGQSHAPAAILKEIHNTWVPWITVANLVLHVAGALKHQFDGHPVLWRMIPWLRRD